jgi:hypothetical protein
MKKAVLLLSIFSFTFAQDNLEELKRQLEEQRRQIRELEKKIEALEKQKPEATKEVKKEQESAPADRSIQLRSKYDERLKALQITPTSQRSLLNLSLIVDTSFVARNKNDQEFKHLEIPGLYHRHEGNGHGHGTLNEKRGFNLNYAELYLYAPVDPYFDLYATIPFSEDGSEWRKPTQLPEGFPLAFSSRLESSEAPLEG